MSSDDCLSDCVVPHAPSNTSNEFAPTKSMRRVGIIVNTPAQVHFYHHIYERLLEDGHQAFIIARAEQETMDLLHEFDIPHSIFSTPPESKVGKILTMPRDVVSASQLLKKERVDIITGFGVYDAYCSALLSVPNVLFIDNEPKIGLRSYALQFRLFYPFVDTLITPSYFREDLGEKQIRINGIKEFAYLHPNYYAPDDSVFGELGVNKGERYFILRFNGLSAFHDLGVGGFTPKAKVALVKELEEHGHVFISSEKDVPTELKKHVIKIPKSRIHDALYYASLLVTDTQTMATEAAILGTPTVRCNSFVGPHDMGNFIELENRYRLLFNFSDFKEAMSKAIEIAEDDGAKAEWGRRRNRLFEENIDVTAFMAWCIENYPESLNELRSDTTLQKGFK
jgi:predicted glycosyltransferase